MSRHIVAAFALVVCAPNALSAQPQHPTAGRDLAANCFTCHGTNGNSAGGVPPSLAGRDKGELLRALLDFQSGRRPATIMHQQAKGYTAGQLEAIAGYFASVKPAPPGVPSKR